MKTEVETTEHDIGTFMIKSDLMVVSDPVTLEALGVLAR